MRHIQSPLPQKSLSTLLLMKWKHFKGALYEIFMHQNFILLLLMRTSIIAKLRKNISHSYLSTSKEIENMSFRHMTEYILHVNMFCKLRNIQMYFVFNAFKTIHKRWTQRLCVSRKIGQPCFIYSGEFCISLLNKWQIC